MRRVALIGVFVMAASCAAAASLRDQAGEARHAGQYAQAEQMFRRAVAEQPRFAPLYLDLATVLVDQKKFVEAGDRLQQYRTRFGENEAYWLTMGYWHDRQGRFFDSLADYDHALRINPRSDVAMQNYIQTADTLGVPDKAITLAQQYPQAINQEGWLRLYSDSAAYAVRNASLDEREQAVRKQRIQEAIRRCDKVIAFLYEHFPDRVAAMQQARMDRMLAWEMDGRHQAVLDEYAALAAEQVVLRDDVRVFIAQSALHLENPDVAISVLQPLMSKKTKDANARTMLFYAQLEAEQFGEARKTIDALVADEKPWLYGKSSRVTNANWNRENADYNSIMLEAWGNRLEQAQHSIEQYQALAPFNADLRSAVGQVYQLRGWPRRAEDWQHEALHVVPDLYSGWSGVVGSRMDLYDFPAVEKITQKLVKEHPELKSSETLQEDWDIHNMQELSMTFSVGHSQISDDSGGSNNASSVNGSRDLDVDAWWYSKPIDYQYRAFLHTSSQTGAFEEGDGQIDRYGVGLEQRDQIGDVAYRNTVELNRSYASDADVGLALTTEWQLDDNWSVDGAVETFSAQLPVRAYNAGVTAHSVNGGVRYRVNEGEYYRAGLAYVDFSDGNQRWMLNAQGYQVVWSNPHHQLALVESMYSSTNSEKNTLYFNPESDLDAGLAVEYQGILRRHYDFEFRHTLLMGVGAYTQSGFGTNPTAQILYRHNWKRDKTLEWHYGIGLNYHPYDGNQELRSTAFGGFVWRFE